MKKPSSNCFKPTLAAYFQRRQARNSETKNFKQTSTLDKLHRRFINTEFFRNRNLYNFIQINKKADDFVLKFDKLYKSAKVIINGQDAGIVWSLPFEINVGKYLKKGKNNIQIEVSNLMANRIRYMDQN